MTTTPATTPDDQILPPIHAALAHKAVLPATHLVDCGYTSSEILVQSQAVYGVHIVGPVAHDPSWQAREQTGYDNSAFTLNWEHHHAVCPQGKHSGKWLPDTDIAGQAVIQIRFRHKDCFPCPVRTHCTRGKREPRTITVRQQVYHEALQHARRNQQTATFQRAYAMRAGIESTIAQAVRSADLRRTRYRGIEKTHLHHVISVVALNVLRVGAWFQAPSVTPRRQSAFARFGAFG